LGLPRIELSERVDEIIKSSAQVIDGLAYEYAQSKGRSYVGEYERAAEFVRANPLNLEDRSFSLALQKSVAPAFQVIKMFAAPLDPGDSASEKVAQLG
jgi:hypothetical protein